MKNDFDFEDVILRAKKAFKIKEDKELAEFIGLKANAFYNRKKAQSLPLTELLLAANTEKVSFDWLLTGEGEMYHEAKNTSFSGRELDRQEQAAFDLFLALSPTQRKEISAAILEKKRVLELENRVNQLEQRQYA